MKHISRSVLARFILSYLLVLAIPLIIGIRIYYGMITSIANNVYDNNILLLQQSSSVIDQNLNAIFDNIVNLKSNNIINDYLKIENPYLDRTNISDYLIAQKELPILPANNLKPIFAVYSVKSNCLFSANFIQFQSEKTYDLHTTYAGGMDYDKWNRDFLNSVYKNEFLKSHPFSISGLVENNYMVYADSIIGVNNKLLGNLFIFIPESNMSDLVGFKSNQDYCYACIIDRDRQVVMEYKNADFPLKLPDEIISEDKFRYEKENINGEPMLITYYNNSDYGWRYITITPFSIINQRVNSVRSNIVILIAALVLIGIFLSILLAYRNILPIRKLIQIMIRQNDKQMENISYSHLDVALTSLIKHSDSLKAELDRQLPAMQASLFCRWLNGDFDDSNQIIKEFANSGISLDSLSYVVLIMNYEMQHPTSIEMLGTQRAIIKALLKQELPGLVDIYDMNFSTLVFVCGMNEKSRQICCKTIEGYIYNIQSVLHDKVGLLTNYAGSITGKDVSRIYITYGEAQRAMSSQESKSVSGNDSITWYHSDCLLPQKTIYYPIDMEMKLIQALQAGNEKSTIQILSQIFSENTMKNAINTEQFHNLITVLQSTIIRIYQSHSQDAIIYTNELQRISESIEGNPQYSDLYNKIQMVFLQICREMRESHQRQQQCLKWQIEQYIAENFHDHQFSLQVLADHFGYASTYMSRFFKEQMGEQFYAYLTNIRLREASKLIKQKDISVEEIAYAVGYNSSQVFRRVFHKIHGCTPMEYKKR